MEEAFFDVPLYREFAQLDANERMPDESTILRFRHRLEKHKLADAILVQLPKARELVLVRRFQWPVRPTGLRSRNSTQRIIFRVRRLCPLWVVKSRS